MCDGCFYEVWAIEDAILPAGSTGEEYIAAAQAKLAAYLRDLGPRGRAELKTWVADFVEVGYTGWAGSVLEGVLHAAIDDDNYTPSYRDICDWATNPETGRGGWRKTGEYTFNEFETGVLDRWDAFSEEQRSIIVAILNGYPMYVAAVNEQVT